jgi:pimeloyl-ACP methyl ester carboxylesterase
MAQDRPFADCPAHGAARGVTVLHDVAFHARHDGSTQRYVMRFPPEYAPDAPRDVLLAFHGHGSDRWQFVTQTRDECQATRDFADAHGLLLLSPDYRAATSWMGPAAEADVVQIIEETRQRFPVRRVFLCGGSMGGTACLIFAVRQPERVAGVAAMNGTANLVEYANFSEAIAASYGGSRAEVPEQYRGRSAEFHPERLTMPLGLTVSGRDESVPPHSVRRLTEALRARGRRVLLIDREAAGHVTAYDDARAILDFMLAQADACAAHHST